VADVAQIARLAETLVANVRNNASVDISVETRIVDTEYLDVDEFESDVSDFELAAIDSISVRIYDGGESGWRIRLWFGKRSPVVLLHVSGPERTFVMGAAEQVREAINDRRRRPRYGPEQLGRAAAIAVGAVLMAIAAFAAFRVYDEWDYRFVNLLLASGLAIPASFAVSSWVESRFPHLELVPSDGQTLAERVRRRINRWALALAGLVIAAVVTALVAKILS